MSKNKKICLKLGVHNLYAQLVSIVIVFILGLSAAFVFWGRNAMSIAAVRNEPAPSVISNIGQVEINELIRQKVTPSILHLEILALNCWRLAL